MENLEFSSLRYGQLLHNLTANLESGGRIGLTGPNGCGKTTLLRLLSGWLAWQEGSFKIGGQSQLNLPPERRRLVLLPTRAALYPHLSVRENIKFPARSLPSKDQTDELIASLRLEALANRKPNTLSLGEQQRVAWARALNRPASWLLADEALTHLDGPQRQHIWNTLNQHWKGGLLLVTHQLQQDLPWLDQLYCLQHGNLSRIDLNSLERNPGSSWLASQLRPENVWPGRVLGWEEGDWWVPGEAWQDDPDGTPARWLEPRGPRWKVEIHGRLLWLERSQPGQNLKPDRNISVFLEASTSC